MSQVSCLAHQSQRSAKSPNRSLSEIFSACLAGSVAGFSATARGPLVVSWIGTSIFIHLRDKRSRQGPRTPREQTRMVSHLVSAFVSSSATAFVLCCRVCVGLQLAPTVRQSAPIPISGPRSTICLCTGGRGNWRKLQGQVQPFHVIIGAESKHPRFFFSLARLDRVSSVP